MQSKDDEFPGNPTPAQMREAARALTKLHSASADEIKAAADMFYWASHYIEALRGE